MTSNLFCGEFICNEAFIDKIEQLNNFSYLLKDIVTEELFLKTAKIFLQRIAECDYLKNNLDVLGFLSKENLLEKFKKELSASVGDMKLNYQLENVYEGVMPLGIVTHITPNNAVGLSFLAVLEGVMASNVNILYPSSKEDERVLNALNLFSSCDPTGVIKKKVIAIHPKNKNSHLMQMLLEKSDAVSVWGGDSVLDTIKNKIPPQCKLITWGHKISFAIVTNEKKKCPETLKKIATDFLAIDQQACSSPQVLFFEAIDKKDFLLFSKVFAEIFFKLSIDEKENQLDLASQCEVTSFIENKKLDAIIDDSVAIFENDEKNRRIVAEYKKGLTISPLYKTVIIRLFDERTVIEDVLSLRHYLQTAALAADKKRIAVISNHLFTAGVVRVTPPGEMLSGYLGEPHDGYRALSMFTKVVSLKNNDLDRVCKINHLLPEKSSQISESKLITKDEWQKIIPNKKDSHLFFKSGGSSGKSILSTFSYDSYHKEMAAAADGLLASGLKPKTDKVINLFFGGGLYGGFLSFFTILEKIGCPQFPMGAHTDYKMVGQTIVDHKINVLFGMPSYIITLIKENLDEFQKEKVIEKIYYGGEHFTVQQQEWLKNVLGIKIIKSASYGSVDAGPLGFQCEFCEGGVHHLLSDIKDLEIIKMDEDIPVSWGEVGRLVFTSKVRTEMPVVRYEIGDVGRFIDGPCKCLRTAKRFELLGRVGDVFKAGGTFFNYQKFLKIINDFFSYQGELQLIINKEELLDCVVIKLDKLFVLNEMTTDQVREVIIENYHDLYDAMIIEKMLSITVEFVDGTDFKRTTGSGKLVRVLDIR